MKRLSVIIVNYNVKYFLEHCLNSVFKALQTIPSEVFVVDNQSVDGSVEMINEKFPQVNLILNKENVGFSKANNQAIRIAKGEYILLLNPDTLVGETTFSLSLDFIDKHPDAGALGIKMIDGKGNFLPESKRGLPTPWVAFYKVFGLSSIFPHSKKFSRYHLRHLHKDKNQEVEVLAGAFMLIRKKALDKSGLLDENFFMYGEDIDLSYRIMKAGYKNYYFADSSIIHYKGESTKKGSLNYIYMFYRAMTIFTQTHFFRTCNRFFPFLIHLAIYLRALLSAIKKFIKALSLPLFDAIILISGLIYITDYWEKNHRFIKGGEYPDEYLLIAFPLYTVIWTTAICATGGYRKPARISDLLRGIFLGTLIILVGYSLLDENHRFSRAIILLGSMWAVMCIPFSRFVIQKIFKIPFLISVAKDRRILLVSEQSKGQRVKALIEQTLSKDAFIGLVAPREDLINQGNYIGSLNQIRELTRIFDIDEIIFCSRDVSYNDIFRFMEKLNSLNVEIKIAPQQSDFVIGSNSINTHGSWYISQFNAISMPANKRAKRSLDFTVAILLSLSLPINIWWIEKKENYLQNLWRVLTAKKTWVGYDESVPTSHLPFLRKSILLITSSVGIDNKSEKIVNQMNQLYAKNYNVWTDVDFIIRFFYKLGDN